MLNELRERTEEVAAIVYHPACHGMCLHWPRAIAGKRNACCAVDTDQHP